MKRAAPGDVPDAKRQDTKRDHIVFVGNVCVDICVYVDQFPKEDSKSRTNEVVNRRGGNASTSAIVASYLGTPNVSFVGILGTANSSEIITEDFKSAGVHHDFCIRKDAPQSTSYIILSRGSGSRTIVHHPSLPPMQALDFKYPLDRIRWAHFEGRNHEQTLQIMERMHAENIAISVEVEKIRRDGDIEIFLGTKGVKLVFVSKDYVKARGYDSAEPFFKFCENLCQEGVTIVVPWGEKGAYARGPNGEIAFSIAESVNEVKETLGAGDTFNGAFLHAHVSGKPLKESLDFANMVAGYKIRHQGFACVSKLCKL